jgi:hypothetical protein
MVGGKVARHIHYLYFFRHVKGISGVAAGQQFGEKYLYKIWEKACSNLSIDGVDLYGGTRHSSTPELRKYFTPEEIRNSGTLHTTNKAFDRYLQVKRQDVKNIYEITAIRTVKKSN